MVQTKNGSEKEGKERPMQREGRLVAAVSRVGLLFLRHLQNLWERKRPGEDHSQAFIKCYILSSVLLSYSLPSPFLSLCVCLKILVESYTGSGNIQLYAPYHWGIISQIVIRRWCGGVCKSHVLDLDETSPCKGHWIRRNMHARVGDAVWKRSLPPILFIRFFFLFLTKHCNSENNENKYKEQVVNRYGMSAGRIASY